MSTFVLTVWNLLLNGVGSFVVGWLIAHIALYCFRVQPSGAQVGLLALPFAKIVFDLAHGIPSDSFLWMRAVGIQQDIGSFQIGFGVKWFVPVIQFVLGARLGGHMYGQSFADLLATAATKKISVWAPFIFITVVGSIGVARLAYRLASWFRAWKIDPSERGEVIAVRKLGRRNVRIVVSDRVEGTPFAGGVFTPYICFPKSLYTTLPEDEREAAILHELGHIAHYDVVLVALVGIVEDMFWFVPGLSPASRRLRQACELAADAWAIARGTAPITLASALVRTGETLVSMPLQTTPRIALTGPLLSARITHLLAGPKSARFGFQNRFARIAILAWVSAIAVFSVFFGNH